MAFNQHDGPLMVVLHFNGDVTGISFCSLLSIRRWPDELICHIWLVKFGMDKNATQMLSRLHTVMHAKIACTSVTAIIMRVMFTF